MRKISQIVLITATAILSSCMQKGPNKADPYEAYNREMHKFNMAFDATMIKPPARLYKAVLPPPVRMGVTNFFNNLDLFPTIANDVLQAEFKQTIKDSWRLFINSTIGIAGVFDPAEKWGLPLHSNDFGVTLGKWGIENSPYFVLPLMGPSTIRDAISMPVDRTIFNPTFYVDSGRAFFVTIPLNILDQRSRLFDMEKVLDQALDKYAFIRDAYLQNRQFQITGKKMDPQGQPSDLGALYVEEDELGDYIDDEPSSNAPSKKSHETEKTN